MQRQSSFAGCEYRNSISIIKAMSQKKSFVLRMNIETYNALEKWAADEFRSINGQIEFLLDKNLKESGRKKNNTTEKSKTK